MMHVRTISSITEIDRAVWNSIVERNRLIRTHDYLRAVESSRIDDCRYFYPMVYDGDKLVAHTCLYFISTELDSFAQGAVKQIFSGVRKAWPGFLMMRSIECGTPVALGSTFSYADGIDRNAAFALMVKEAERIASEIGVKILLFRDFHETELSFYDRLLEFGYRRIHNLPGTELKLRWNTFDEYKSSLRSEYRNKVNARIEKFHGSEFSMQFVDNFSPYAATLARLWKNVYDKATEYRREILLEDFFKYMDSGLGDKSAVILARRNGSVAGFMLLFIDDDTLTPIFCGLDYACSREYAVYFNLFYKAIEEGILRKKKDMDLGITTIVPKLELGAAVDTLYMYIKHASPLLNRIVPAAFEMMTPTKAPAAPNVFRKQSV